MRTTFTDADTFDIEWPHIEISSHASQPFIAVFAPAPPAQQPEPAALIAPFEPCAEHEPSADAIEAEVPLAGHEPLFIAAVVAEAPAAQHAPPFMAAVVAEVPFAEHALLLEDAALVFSPGQAMA